LVNLTALGLDPPTEQAIERLVIEPVLASAFVGPEDRTAIDLGSGGGSPGIPMAVMCGGLAVRLVESRLRKAAFLRAAVREMSLGARVQVARARFESLAHQADVAGTADLVTVRAVRADAQLASAAMRLLGTGGRLFLFESDGQEAVLAGFEAVQRVQLTPGSRLAIFRPVLVR
jgi:16S rRNA (guanine527-N7)-methyltransferase